MQRVCHFEYFQFIIPSIVYIVELLDLVILKRVF